MIWSFGGWIFGIVVFAISVINMFWGNDPGYGVFVFFLSFVFFSANQHDLQGKDRLPNSPDSKNHPGSLYPLVGFGCG